MSFRRFLSAGSFALLAFMVATFAGPGAMHAAEGHELKVDASIVDIKTPDEGSFRVYQAEGMFRIDTGSGTSRKTFIFNNTLGTLTSINYNSRTYMRVPIDLPDSRRSGVSGSDITKYNDLKTAAQKERTSVNGAFNYKLDDMRQLSDLMLGTTLCERYTSDKVVRTTVYIDRAKKLPTRITRQGRDGGQVRIFEFYYPGTPLTDGIFEPPMDFTRAAPLLDVVDPAVIAAEQAAPGTEPKAAEGASPAPGAGDTAASGGPVKPPVKIPDNEPFYNTKPLL